MFGYFLKNKCFSRLYKKGVQKFEKLGFFQTGLVYGFSLKMEYLPFFCGKKCQENVFDNILERK